MPSFVKATTWSVGTTYGEVKSVLIPGPKITTTDATDITATGAKLGYIGNANGKATNIVFRYQEGSNTNCTSSQPPLTLNGATGLTGALSGTTAISGLKPNTLYSFCATATNSDGTSYGGTKTFTTAQREALICDNDLDNDLDTDDYNVWLTEFRADSGTRSDCDGESGISIFDYAKWLGEYRKFIGSQ